MTEPTRDEMLDVVRRSVEDDQQRAGNGHGAPGLGVWNAGHDVELPSPRGWLLGNSFCLCFISSVLGDGGTGKTALRILQALALATGRNLTGEHVFRRTRVLIISLEDDGRELRRRVLAARLHHKISLLEVDGWLFLAAPTAAVGKLMTINNKTGGLVTGELAGHIEAAVIEHGIGLVMIDPFIKAHSVPENDNAGMDGVAQLVSDLAAKHDIAIDVPHHISKGAAEPGNANRGRGASATNNAARLVYTLSPMSPEEAQRFNIPEDARREYVRLDRAKLNIARTSGPAKWFKLVSVKLGNATEQYPNGDDVQTVETWDPPNTWAGLDNQLLNRILTVIDQGLDDGNYYTATNSATDRAAWEVVQRLAPDKDEAQCREIINAWLKSGLLVKFDYTNPTTRRPVKGLKVNSTKRPT